MISYPLTNTDDNIEYDTGVDYPLPDRGRADGLTTDEIAWAIEQGAKSEEDVFRLVNEHKEQQEWQQ